MDPNLNANAGFKQLLLKKLSCAVLCSVLSQTIILTLFLLLINIDIFNPRSWIRTTLSTLTSSNTLLFLIPFSVIIFTQSLICAKDYILQQSYSCTRFQRLFNVLSVRNFIILLLYATVGGLSSQLYLSASNIIEDTGYQLCKKEYYCLNHQRTLIILSGLWTGMYFFSRVYVTDRKLQFPVVQQSKWLHFKARVTHLIKESRNASILPVLYLIFSYYLFNPIVRSYAVESYGVYITEEAVGAKVYGYIWVFSALFFLSMNLMRFFFTLFLTESIEFSLVHSDKQLSLQQALNMSHLPIIQNLAALDFYMLSFWSSSRRQALFSLSQPGGHPYNWNALVENALKLLNDYVGSLNRSLDMMLVPDKSKRESLALASTLQRATAPSSLLPQSPRSCANLRNMSLYLAEPTDIVSVEQVSFQTLPVLPENFSKKIQQKLEGAVKTIKQKIGYNYLFDELPEANIQKCLGCGQIVIWTTQALSTIAAASIKEDKYGIVQKDLPMIITALTDLKTALDRLNKVAVFNRKITSYDNFNYKMKLALSSAVKRSLVDIVVNFGVYLKDLSLKKETLQQLQNYVPYVDC